jgi:hypothetical protein
MSPEICLENMSYITVTSISSFRRFISMKLCVIVITLCLLSIGTFGQKATVDGAEKRTDQQRLDATAQQFDSLQAYFTNGADSLEKKYEKELDQIDSVRHRVKVVMDSLSSVRHSLNKFHTESPKDSLEMRWRSKRDMLTMIENCSAKLSAILDSLNRVQERTISALNEKVQYLKERTLERVNELSPQLSEKADQVASKISGFQLEGAGLGIPKLDDGFGVGSVERLDINQVDEPDIEKLQDKLENLADPGNKIGDYADVQNFALGSRIEFESITQVAETKAIELSGLSDIKEKTAVLNEHMEFLQQIEKPDSLKELALQEAKEIAKDHFAGKEEQLQQAMGILAEYKSKYPNLNSIREVARRPPNEMKGKSWIERIVPGLSMHIQKKGEELLLDFNPYAGHKLTSRMLVGVGWNQRVAYQAGRTKFNRRSSIYGPRVIGEFKMRRGFSLRGEVDLMNSNSQESLGSHIVDQNLREWIWGAFVGIKKEYDLIKNLKGTVMMMARIYNGDRPYSDVLNIRFGLEFPKTKPKRNKA